MAISRPPTHHAHHAAPTISLAVAALLVAPLAQVHLVLGVAAVAAGLAAVVLGQRRGVSGSTLRLAVLALALAVLIALAVPFAVWVVTAGLALGGRRWSWLRPAAGWLPRGRADRATWAVGVATVVGAGIALTVWARQTDEFGEGTLQLVDLVGDLPLVALVPLALGFVVVNAVAEEVAYRGIVQEGVAARCSPGIAIAVQAAAFGSLHVAGFPAGPAGMVLAAGYGVVLGWLRMRTGGLRIPVVVHLVADATIVALVWVLVVPSA